MTFFDCTADLVGQLNGNGQKGMLQINAPLSKISGYATGLEYENIGLLSFGWRQGKARWRHSETA